MYLTGWQPVRRRRRNRHAGNGQGLPISGNDTIDASASVKGLAIYGGKGNDVIYGSQAGDHLAGGSGDDEIYGGPGVDHIYGDNGFNIVVAGEDVKMLPPELATPAQLIVVTEADLTESVSGDDLQPGADTISGGEGDDIILGDYGVITQSDGTIRILDTGNVIQIETVRRKMAE